MRVWIISLVVVVLVVIFINTAASEDRDIERICRLGWCGISPYCDPFIGTPTCSYMINTAEDPPQVSIPLWVTVSLVPFFLFYTRRKIK